MTADTDDGLGAVLLQLTGQAERLALLEDRVAGNLRHADTTLTNMSKALTSLRGTVDSQAKVLESLDGLGEAVTQLAAQVAALAPPDPEDPGPGYKPIPAVQWWSIDAEGRDRALARLRDWVTRIYRPHYGHLAATLRDCWADHPLCLVQLDWACELWSVLYLQPARTARDLAAQAEFGTRILPAVSEQLRAETSLCSHRQTTADGSHWAGAR